MWGLTRLGGAAPLACVAVIAGDGDGDGDGDDDAEDDSSTSDGGGGSGDPESIRPTCVCCRMAIGFDCDAGGTAKFFTVRDVTGTAVVCATAGGDVRDDVAVAAAAAATMSAGGGGTIVMSLILVFGAAVVAAAVEQRFASVIGASLLPERVLTKSVRLK